MNYYHVYKKKSNGMYWHITDVSANTFMDAVARVRKMGRKEDYRVTGVMLDTGRPYDAADFPLHVRNRINKTTTYDTKNKKVYES